MAAMSRPRRRLLWILVALAAVVAVGAVVALVGGSYARGRVLPAAQEKLGRPVAISIATLGRCCCSGICSNPTLMPVSSSNCLIDRRARSPRGESW